CTVEGHGADPRAGSDERAREGNPAAARLIERSPRNRFRARMRDNPRVTRAANVPALVRSREGKPRVVVVGCGFGGLWTARALRRAPVELIVIDRNNYHLF